MNPLFFWECRDEERSEESVRIMSSVDAETIKCPWGKTQPDEVGTTCRTEIKAECDHMLILWKLYTTDVLPSNFFFASFPSQTRLERGSPPQNTWLYKSYDSKSLGTLRKKNKNKKKMLSVNTVCLQMIAFCFNLCCITSHNFFVAAKCCTAKVNI